LRHNTVTLVYCRAGATHKDSLYSAIHLASLWKLREKPQDALALLEEALTTAEAAYTRR
jgi:hypothetical protein